MFKVQHRVSTTTTTTTGTILTRNRVKRKAGLSQPDSAINMCYILRSITFNEEGSCACGRRKQWPNKKI